MQRIGLLRRGREIAPVTVGQILAGDHATANRDKIMKKLAKDEPRFVIRSYTGTASGNLRGRPSAEEETEQSTGSGHDARLPPPSDEVVGEAFPNNRTLVPRLCIRDRGFSSGRLLVKTFDGATRLIYRLLACLLGLDGEYASGYRRQ